MRNVILFILAIIIMIFLTSSCNPSTQATNQTLLAPTDNLIQDFTEFELGCLNVSPENAVADQDLVVSVDISNKGTKSGIYSALLYLNGQNIDTKDITIESGQTTKVQFIVKNIQAGKHSISIEKSNIEIDIPENIGKIVYSSLRSDTGTANIYIMNSDGSNQQKVRDCYKENRWHDISPDGQKIVFESWEEWHGRPVISVINIDGSGYKLISGDLTMCECPAWSPDGTKIVFDRIDKGFTPATATPPRTLWVMDLNGENPICIPCFPDVLGTSSRFPSWFPDSQTVVFESNYCGFWQIYSKDISEPQYSTTLHYTQMGKNYNSPSVSPDGKKIACSCDGSIYIIDVESHDQIKITDDELKAAFPSWSPDGKKIAFTGGVEFFLKYWNLIDGGTIYVMNSDGTDVNKIIDNGFFPKWLN
jgi:Tol biopolymer transport system component